MTLSDIGFGIVGAGMVARYHATAIERIAGARLVAVCRADAARAAEAAARFGVEFSLHEGDDRTAGPAKRSRDDTFHANVASLTPANHLARV